MDNELREKLQMLKVMDIPACELYIYAYNHNMDYTKIIINKADIERIGTLLKGENTIDLVERRYNEYRNLFKDTRGRGELGDIRRVKINLVRFLIEHSDISFDQLLEITKEYIDSFYGNFNYMRRADYFLYKYLDGIWLCPIETFMNRNKTIEESGLNII